MLVEVESNVLEKGDLEMLRVVLKTAREDRTLLPRQADVVLLNEVGAKLLEFADQENLTLAKCVGQRVEWTVADKRIAGRIAAVKDGAIDLIVSHGNAAMRKTVNLSELCAEDQAKLRTALQPREPVEQMAAALLRLKKDAHARFGQRLDASARKGLDRDRFHQATGNTRCSNRDTRRRTGA